MGTEENRDRGFPLSEKVGEMAMSSGSMFKSSNGADRFFGSGWDPLGSLGHSELANPAYPVVLGNQAITGSSHLVHYHSDSGLGEMVPKLPYFASGAFSEMVSSLGLPECGQIAGKTSTSGPHSQEECKASDEGASPNRKKKRRASESHSPFNPNKNAEEQQHDPSGESSEYRREEDEKKHKVEQNSNKNLLGKQTGKQAKDNSDSGEAPKENYIHVRAKRGQATNSHSLAERVRRERISERMRLLQELVPGCNKITGKAVMLDEIINYVQSLQQQVEFLSMKLATVNPDVNIDIERILSKDILHSRGSNGAIHGFGPGLISSHPYSQGISQGSSIPNTNPPFHPMSQAVWDTELQSLLQMGFDSNSAMSNLGPHGRSKLEL